jgi:hypothetical protein
MADFYNLAPSAREPDVDVDALERDGFLVLKNLLSEEMVEALARELEPWLQATPRCQGDFYGWKTTRLGGLLSKAATTQKLALYPRVLGIAQSMLKASCDCIQLNLTQVTRIHPGERAQVPHRDEEMWPPQGQIRPWLINVMWAVSDFTQENGATRLWPGSHRASLDRDLDSCASIAVEMPKGSACIFLGSLTHGAGANVSCAPRTGVIISYCLGWLRSYENQYLAYPRETARSFAPELLRLIGYQMHRPNLGGWEGQDPIAYLSRGGGAHGPHVDALTPEIAEEIAAHYEGERVSRA